jgi:hypothetical protein
MYGLTLNSNGDYVPFCTGNISGIARSDVSKPVACMSDRDLRTIRKEYLTAPYNTPEDWALYAEAITEIRRREDYR